MAATKLNVRKATALLREDHRNVKKLFSDYEGLEAGDTAMRAEIFKQVHQELTAHAAIEEEIFYPAVQGVKKGATEGEEIVREAEEEHQVVKTLLAELSGMTPDDVTFDARMKVLAENVE